MASKQAKIPAEGKAFEAFVEYRSAARQKQFKELVERTKRVAAAGRGRQRVLRKMAKSAGIDLDAIDALHAKEWESLSKPSKDQERAAARMLKLQKRSQRLALSSINKYRDRFEYQKGNPHTSMCRWTAIAAPTVVVNPQTFNQGTVTIGVLPPGVAPTVNVAGRNIIRSRVTVRANRSSRDPFRLIPAAAVDIFSRHVFEAVVPHDGILSVVANYEPAANIFLGAPGSCTFPGEASAEVLLFMFVEVDKPDGTRTELPLGSTNTIIDSSIDASCDGTNRMIFVGTENGVAFQLAHNEVIDVDAGDIVRARAGFDIFLRTALGGVADAIFSAGNMGLNVPMVLFKVDS